ncbi:uncharacterized protein [Coffea arabica]|uniref:Uncharacterized protein n=1 Tax=Coffea arabica TaxID=13443 RepID=A0A6P6TKJ7_COFAR|nr:uncharacterized protein LOC113701541 [Coffea arabica]
MASGSEDRCIVELPYAESMECSEKERIGSFSSRSLSHSGSDDEGCLDHPQKGQQVEMLPGILEESVDGWKGGWEDLTAEALRNVEPFTEDELRALCTSLNEFERNRRCVVPYVDPKVWDKYVQEVEESEGFDVFTNPGPTLGYKPITTYKRDKELEKKLIGLAKQALAEKLPCYEFVAIEWVTGYRCAGWVYNITFRARGADAPEGKSFQARVYAGIVDVRVKFCRPKVVKT